MAAYTPRGETRSDVALSGVIDSLGRQGIYAAMGALFVLTDGPVSVAASAARIREAVFGAAVGIGINELIRPTVYMRDARSALLDVSHEAQELLSRMDDRLANGKWDTALAGRWHEQVLRLGRLVGHAGSAIGWSRESMRGNHRGLGVGASPGRVRGTTTR